MHNSVVHCQIFTSKCRQRSQWHSAVSGQFVICHGRGQCKYVSLQRWLCCFSLLAEYTFECQYVPACVHSLWAWKVQGSCQQRRCLFRVFCKHLQLFHVFMCSVSRIHGICTWQHRCKQLSAFLRTRVHRAGGQLHSVRRWQVQEQFWKLALHDLPTGTRSLVRRIELHNVCAWYVCFDL